MAKGKKALQKNVVFAVNAAAAGTYSMAVRYGNATGSASTGSYRVTDVAGSQISSGALSFPNLSDWDQWGNVNATVALHEGLNLIATARDSSDTGAFNLDSIDLNNGDTGSGGGNLIVNGGFETGSIANWTEWHPSGQVASYGVDSNDVHSGHYKLYFYNGTTAFLQSVHQTVSVPNGTYTVTASVKLQSHSGTPPTTARMEVSGYGGSQLNVNIVTDASYQTISQTVTVTNGQADVGFYLDAAADTSLQIDDVSLAL